MGELLVGVQHRRLELLVGAHDDVWHIIVVDPSDRGACLHSCHRGGKAEVVHHDLIRSGAGGPAYSASKAGVIQLVRVAATQLCGANIRVNAICPGLIETGMTRGLYDMARAAGKEDQIGHLNPLKRGGVPDEIAHAALFLASDESSYVNGQALGVDGGLSASHPFYRQEYGRTSF